MPLWLHFRIYYQGNPECLSACPVTIHGLLHVADSILESGPVWASWAFPMEHYCGALKPAIQSRHFPYTTLAHYVVDSAHLTQIKLQYNADEALALCAPHVDHSTSIPGCEWIFFLWYSSTTVTGDCDLYR